MTFETERLLLRPWTDEDAQTLYELASDPLVGPSTGWPAHTSVEESLQCIRNILSAKGTYAVCLKDSLKVIGDISLMTGDQSAWLTTDREGELGFWLGSKYWGNGYIPEACRELMRYAFAELGFERLWCGYFEGNAKSARCQEKLGFTYVETKKDLFWKPLGIQVNEIVNCLTREAWIRNFSIVSLAERKDLTVKAAAWFADKWGIPEEAYRESMEESFEATETGVPGWYLCLEADKILGGMGVIENDFHPRTDLTPNVCGVYTEPGYRKLGIAGLLLKRISDDMKKKGCDTLYLLTDHTGFYERYGWEYLCPVTGDGEEEPSRMYIHRA